MQWGMEALGAPVMRQHALIGRMGKVPAMGHPHTVH